MNGNVQVFDKALERWVVDAASDESVRNFDDLVCRLPGVYPTDVREALVRLETSGGLSVAAVTQLRQRSRGGSARAPARHLPVPHPLDFDWRFSAGAVEYLVTECERLSGGEPIVLLGAPTVFWGVRERGRMPALLLDANPAVVASFATDGRCEARQCDFRQGVLPDVRSSVVLLDPPWYPEHERLFLWTAARLCARGATALVSLPAAGTRPGVADETAAALRSASRWGLNVEAIEPGFLGYLSPPFERNALAAAGLPGIPAEWRRGDLVRLRASGDAVHEPPPRVPMCSWPEVAIGQVRFRLRIPERTFFGRIVPQLNPIVPGDVLDSVSRRDPRRELVDVWTSGNRVFGCASPGVLLWILQAMRDRESADTIVASAVGRSLTRPERRNIRIAVDQVYTLVSTEMEELAAMGWAA